MPTLLGDDRASLADAVRHFGTAVVKPRVSAGGAGLIVVSDPDDPRLGRPVRSSPDQEFGRSVRAVETGDVADLVLAAHDAMGERFGRPMDYVRVDLLQWEGEWVVSELELIEPGLYLDVSPANAAPFADLVEARL